MLKAKNTEEKEEQIIEIIQDISSWWHKWEENRNGENIVCIEYKRMFDPERDGISVKGDIS